MDTPIEKQKKKYIAGVQIKTSNEEGRAEREIGTLWNRFIEEKMADKISNKINSNILVVYSDYEGDYTQPYSCTLGCEVASLDQIQNGFIGKTIPESTYAVFTPKGDFPSCIGDEWRKIWKSALKRTYTTDFEIYPSNFYSVKNPDIKIYIAVQG